VKALRALPPVLLGAVVAGIAWGAPAQPPVSSASALVVQVTVPGQGSFSAGAVSGPPNATSDAGVFAYPADGSVARVGSGSSATVVQAGTSSSAQATAAAHGVSLFGGEVAVDSVDVRATAAAGAVNATGDVSASTVTGLVLLGQPVTPSPNAQLPVADWGTLEVLTSTTETRLEAPRSSTATVTGLRLRLVADHGGLPVGSEVVVGTVTAVAAAAAAPTQQPPATLPTGSPDGRPAPAPSQPTTPGTSSRPSSGTAGYLPGGVRVPVRRARPNVGLDPGTTIPGRPPELVKAAPEVTARLTSGGYVFPVYGPASFGDSFGAPRHDVSGGWHHGEDIFAPLGTPLLAVADGTVFSVGWNDIGGWRLWVRDTTGNEFYYAHLSAYSPLAVDGHHVKAGDVLGFMGGTGDAAGNVHLHFEIHPRELLGLGYDGAVAPYPFLVAWRRAEDADFAAGRRFVAVSPRDGLPRGTAPPAGAILLEADDISRTSGLVPGALERALGGPKADEARLVPRSG
jgi:murein DD-endopeptidase MepM/ murein hydrolase activator NlpD